MIDTVQYDQAGATGVWYATNGVVHEVMPLVLAGEPGTRSVHRDVTLHRRSLVDRVRLVVGATPGGPTTIGSVADVRVTSGAAPEAIVDFGALVTVSQVTLGQVTAVEAWTGTGFAAVGDETGMGEIATERLRLVLSSPVSEDDVRASSVVLPAMPTGLELAIGGTTVWFERQGSDPGGDPDALYDVDRTDAFREAFQRATSALPEQEEQATVRVALRAGTPGRLTLSVEPVVRGVHRVTFPDGPRRTLAAAAEGPIAVRLPVDPARLKGRQVQAVDLVVRADIGPERTVPASGPAPVHDAVLTLRPGRTMLAHLPDALRAQLVDLHAVRLLLSGGPTDAEVGGRLLAGSLEDGDALTEDDPGAPGEPVPGGELVPTIVPAGDEPRWTTLALAEPAALSAAAWLELQAVSGTPTWSLTAAGTTGPDADIGEDAALHGSSPGATLRRRLPGGGVRGLSTVAALGERRGCLRLVGVPDPNAPVPALVLGVQGGTDDVPLTPTTDDAGVHIGLQAPLEVDETLDLVLVGAVAAPGTYTLDQIDVVHQESPR